MAFSHQDVIKAQAEQLAATRAEAVGQYEAGRLQEDADVTMAAANAIIEADAKLQALGTIARQLQASEQQLQQQPRGSQFGLNHAEQEVAKISGISEETYARNKQRMHQMKGEGYWSQGKVFK